MKTPKGIMVLAKDTQFGHRDAAHQDFRTVVAANGYQMSRGGWVKFGGETVCRGWETFASMVLSGQIVLQDILPGEEPATEEPATTTDDVAPTALEYAGSHGFRPNGQDWQGVTHADRCAYPDCGASPDSSIHQSRMPLDVVAEPVHQDFVYIYTTHTDTISLSEMTVASAMITDTQTAHTEGPCESGAALDCTGFGFQRILPESMLPGSQREQMIQCVPCYEASANAYIRKLHGYQE